MVPAVWSKAGAGGKLLLDAAVDTGREMQLNMEPSDLTLTFGDELLLLHRVGQANS